VIGDEAPAQEVIIDRLETMNLEPDVREPSADNLADHEGYWRLSYEAYGYEGRPNAAARVEGGNGPTLAIGGHIDVVDVTEDEWTRAIRGR